MVDMKSLYELAVTARDNAFAPYSNYRVGAAVLGESGKVYTGSNVEISSFSLTCCAERVAVFSAISAGERKILAGAVVTGDKEIPTPCGACRQVLHDFGPDMVLLLGTVSGLTAERSLSELLPSAFDSSWLLEHMSGN